MANSAKGPTSWSLLTVSRYANNTVNNQGNHCIVAQNLEDIPGYEGLVYAGNQRECSVDLVAVFGDEMNTFGTHL